jgi:RNA polymerase sigma factor (sigma-70 family)
VSGDILCHRKKEAIEIRADRLVSIILILQSRGTRTCAALAEELEVSRRTILRDLEALSFAGVPVIAEGGRGGGVRLDESYRSGLTGLGEGELRALVLGADAALASDLGMGEAFRLGKLKLLASKTERFDPALERLQRRVFVDSRWWWHEESAESFLPLLQEAVFRDEAVEAEYEHYDGSLGGGRIEPYGLVAKAGQWYLVGRRGEELRSYRVSRFRSVRLTGEAFERDESFDLREWWPANGGRFASEFSAYRFVLALPEEGLRLVRRLAPGRASLRGPDPERRGWIVAEIGVDSSLYAELIVLGLGGECRVIEPASLGAAVDARARAALARADVGRLYEESLGQVCAFLLRMTGDPEEARDIAQEAFAIALAKADSFRGDSSPLTWVLSIAKNLCRRRLSRERERSFADIEAIVDEHASEPPAQSEQERAWYLEAVKQGCLLGLVRCLSFDQRCAFILCVLNDLPAEQTARIMGRSENSVRILLTRSRSALRDFLCRNCALMGASSRCSCERMIGFSLSRGLVERCDPERTVPAIARELRRFSDEVELYRSLPAPEAEIAALVSAVSASLGKAGFAK